MQKKMPKKVAAIFLVSTTRCNCERSTSNIGACALRWRQTAAFRGAFGLTRAAVSKGAVCRFRRCVLGNGKAESIAYLPALLVR